MSAQPTGPGILRRASPGEIVLQALGLVLFCALCLVVLLEPSFSPLKRNIAPVDQPWIDHGMTKLTVEPDGTWKIRRGGYVDRMRRLEISPGGALTATHDDAMQEGVVDVSGGFDVVQRTTDAGSVVSVRPSHAYFNWRRDLRKGGNKNLLNKLPDPASDAGARPGAVGTVPVAPMPLSQGKEPLAIGPWPESGDFSQPHFSTVLLPDTGVRIQLNQHLQLVYVDLLPGHWYLPDVGDCSAFKGGKLWLTMDRQRNLYRLRIDEPANKVPQVTVEAAAPLALPGISDRDSRLGLDPGRQQLFLQRADGMRYWFDPDTLKQVGSDKLPGVWEPEYASFDPRLGDHNGWIGQPLSRQVYERIMRIAMVLFLAGLLGLAMLWRPQWKSTSAAITADSNSNADSENT